ncbi:MAG: class I SAM-dependent methyltransferase [Solirubrobacteraceae bacterium]
MREADIDDVSDVWERNAQDWLAWARTPEHDVLYLQLNLPAFAELLSQPGRRTLDVGCGEGRLGRTLADEGHRVIGIDSSPTLAAHALSAGGYEEIVCADAAAMPWPDAHCDLAVAFMSLHDMPHPRSVIGEIARVLEPGGVLVVAIVHPLNRPDEHLEDYLTDRRFSGVVTRRGLRMSFEGVDRPLDSYTRALADAGFVIEELREPRAASVAVTRFPELEPAARKPFFLHLRCRRLGISPPAPPG